MTKYKLLKPIKNVDWCVGEVRETEEDYDGDSYIKINNFALYPVTLALTEHLGFIEEVEMLQPTGNKISSTGGGNGNGRVGGGGGGADSRIIPVGVGDVAVCCGGDTIRTFMGTSCISVGSAPLETPKRWRAEKGGDYYYLDTGFRVQAEWDDYGDYDNNHYKAGNYFQTTEQLEEFRKGVKALVGIN